MWRAWLLQSSAALRQKLLLILLSEPCAKSEYIWDWEGKLLLDGQRCSSPFQKGHGEVKSSADRCSATALIQRGEGFANKAWPPSPPSTLRCSFACVAHLNDVITLQGVITNGKVNIAMRPHYK